MAVALAETHNEAMLAALSQVTSPLMEAGEAVASALATRSEAVILREQILWASS